MRQPQRMTYGPFEITAVHPHEDGYGDAYETSFPPGATCPEPDCEIAEPGAFAISEQKTRGVWRICAVTSLETAQRLARALYVAEVSRGVPAR